MISFNFAFSHNEDLTIEELYNKYSRQMFLIAKSILHSNADAEDAVHDVFLKISKKHMNIIQKFSCEEDVRNYLLKATKNTALNIGNKHKREMFIFGSSNGINRAENISNEQFIETVCQKSEYDRIVKAIVSMDERYRDVLYYHLVAELSVYDVSRLLNRKVSTVKKQLVRGKKQLIDLLEKEESLSEFK